MAEWESQIAAERMAVDGEFADRVTQSSLTSQQWNLVMTAVGFEIENPDTPAEATLVADTSRLPSMMSEIERVGSRGPMGGDGGPARGDDGGLLGGILSSLGINGGGNDEVQETAVELADEYATRLQSKLVERGRWERVCEQAADSSSQSQ